MTFSCLERNFVGRTATTLLCVLLWMSLLQASLSVDLSGKRAVSARAQTELYCKLRWFLQIAQDGTVNGTYSLSDTGALLELQSVGRDLKRIKGVHTGKYVAMNSKGIVYSSNVTNAETIFKEEVLSNGYLTFSSQQYYSKVPGDMFLAFRKNGTMRKGRRTKRLHASSQFLMWQN